MWFIFPQIAGLGSSPMAHVFAISGRAEADAYLPTRSLGASPAPMHPACQRNPQPHHRRNLRLSRRPEIPLVRHSLCRRRPRRTSLPRRARQVLRRPARPRHAQTSLAGKTNATPRAPRQWERRNCAACTGRFFRKYIRWSASRNSFVASFASSGYIANPKLAPTTIGLSLNHDRTLNRAAQRVGKPLHRVRVRHVRHHDDELVAAQPRHRVRRPDALAQHARHLAQHLVPGNVPQRIVDLFEVVQVQHHQRQAGLLPLASTPPRSSASQQTAGDSAARSTHRAAPATRCSIPAPPASSGSCQWRSATSACSTRATRCRRGTHSGPSPTDA